MLMVMMKKLVSVTMLLFISNPLYKLFVAECRHSSNNNKNNASTQYSSGVANISALLLLLLVRSGNAM